MVIHLIQAHRNMASSIGSDIINGNRLFRDEAEDRRCSLSPIFHAEFEDLKKLWVWNLSRPVAAKSQATKSGRFTVYTVSSYKFY